MSIVAGVAEYLLNRSSPDTNYATQSHQAQMDALVRGMQTALRGNRVRRDQMPAGNVTSLGSEIFAFLASGNFTSIEEAQDAFVPGPPFCNAGRARGRGI